MSLSSPCQPGVKLLLKRMESIPNIEYIKGLNISRRSYSYARSFRANWVSTHSNLERLVLDSIGFSVLERALR